MTRFTLLTALVMLSAAASAAVSARQTFRIGAEGVRVDVLVRDGNRPVGGLTAADFELRDSGVLQRVESAAFEDIPLNVMLALDTSDSVAGKPLEHLKQAALAVVRLLRPEDRGALLTFNDHVSLRAGWTSDAGKLEAAISRTDTGGATALYDASFAALTHRDTQQGRMLVLIFSDGEDTASWLPGQSVIDIANRNDAVVYAVELRPRILWSPGYLVDLHSGPQTAIPSGRLSLSDRFLEKVSEETGGKHLNAAESEELRDAFVRIVTEFRTRYLLTYTPKGVEAGGWHPITVKLKHREGRVTARRGYLR